MRKSYHSCRIKRGAKWAIKKIYLFCNLSYATLLMIYCFHRWIFTAIVATTTRSCLTNKGIHFKWKKIWAWHERYCCTSSIITHTYLCMRMDDGTKNRSLTSCVLPSSYFFLSLLEFNIYFDVVRIKNIFTTSSHTLFAQ